MSDCNGAIFRVPLAHEQGHRLGPDKLTANPVCELGERQFTGSCTWSLWPFGLVSKVLTVSSQTIVTGRVDMPTSVIGHNAAAALHSLASRLYTIGDAVRRVANGCRRTLPAGSSVLLRAGSEPSSLPSYGITVALPAGGPTTRSSIATGAPCLCRRG